jgi:CDP-paratose 2-epimerase
MRLLVTGGCGFLGSNLVEHALKQNIDVIVFDNLQRFGSSENLIWLQSLNKRFIFYHGDIRNTNDIEQCIIKYQPDFIFHLAGQVAMTTSINNPRLDFETNILGTFNLLEAIRKYSPETPVIYSSTNKVYGDLEYLNYTENNTRYICDDFPHGFDESINLNFQSPYGVSKGSADQYMQDYSRIYGLKTVVFRHSSMYGGRQFATYDQGWIGWFCQKAIETQKNKDTIISISGNGKQVRDVLHSSDMISLYFKTIDCINNIKGQVFNIGGGIHNSLSLLELFRFVENQLDIKINIKYLPVRESDQKVFIANINKINKLIGWSPKNNYNMGILQMLEWVNKAIFK